MALHDVEGKIHSVDPSIQRKGLGTNSVSPVREGQTVGKVVTKSNQILSKDSAGVNRVLLGYQKDGFGTGSDQGIKVSQNGYDVLTAANANLVMSSAFNNFKIVASGVIASTKAAGADTATVDLKHNLNAYPACSSFVSDGSTYMYIMPMIIWENVGGTIQQLYKWYASDANTIQFQYQVITSSGLVASTYSWYYKYYLMVETGS